MIIVRILVAVLAILAVLIAPLSGLDAHEVLYAVLPLACLYFAWSLSSRFVPTEYAASELTGAPALLSDRAPPVV